MAADTGIEIGSLNDLVEGTLRNSEPMGFNIIGQRLRRYQVMSEWLRKDRVLSGSGYGVRRVLMDQVEHVARHKGLAATDQPAIHDHLTHMQLNFRHTDTYMQVDKVEALANRGRSLLANVIAPRKFNAMESLAYEMEDAAWSVTPESDEMLPVGLPVFICYNATDGYTGAVPSSYSGVTVAGISTTTHPNYKNHCMTYVDMTPLDGLRKIRESLHKCYFIRPTSVSEFRGPLGRRFRLYTTLDLLLTLEDLVRAQNEDIGVDLYEFDGSTVIRGFAVREVPYLTENAASGSAPVYGVDHDSFIPYVMKGNFMAQTGPKMSPRQHTVSETFWDCSYLYCCLNRKSNFLVAKSEPFA